MENFYKSKFSGSEIDSLLTSIKTMEKNKETLSIATLNSDGLFSRELYNVLLKVKSLYTEENLKVGRNLKGATIYFDTSYTANKTFLNNIVIKDGISIKQEDYYSTYSSDWSKMHLVIKNGSDTINITNKQTGEWNQNSYTFPNDKDYIVLTVPEDFNDFVSVVSLKSDVVNLLNKDYNKE